jgi:hypothetical protein
LITSRSAVPTLFLLSPASLAGVRAALLFKETSRFPLAQQLRSPGGAPLGEVFSFVSGLYFRGKLAYARAFGQPPEGLRGALVITAGEGLLSPDERVDVARLRSWAEVSIDAGNPAFTEPLVEHASDLARAVGSGCRFVLLGSVATDKYVRPLVRVLGDWLLFPSDFVGLGDMSRGSIMLRAAREGRELAYAAVEGARRSTARSSP